MDAHQLTDIVSGIDRSAVRYLEFIRKSTLSVGVYTLPAGARDPQSPHGEDEVYYLVSGRGAISVAGEEQNVGPGSVVFVAAGDTHRFHSIIDELTVLVFFAPPERARAKVR